MITGNSNNKGFTLIELLIVLVVASILATIAVPSLQGTVKSNAVRSLHSNFHNTLSYARSEAVSRNKFVTICPSVNETSCGGTWADGWLVFVDNASAGAGNGVVDTGEEILRGFNNTGSSQVSMSNADTSVAMSALTWNYRGFVRNDLRALVVVCARDSENRYARGLLVERSGRVMTTRDTDGDGLHDSEFELNELGNQVNSSQLSCS